MKDGRQRQLSRTLLGNVSEESSRGLISDKAAVSAPRDFALIAVIFLIILSEHLTLSANRRPANLSSDARSIKSDHR